MTFIKKAVYIVFFLDLLLLFATGAWAENTAIAAAPKEMPGIPEKFQKIDFENSVCFRRCHQVNDINPSDKTEQQWRMLIEKNGHDIFKKIMWESSDQKEKTLIYLLKHAGGSGAEGIGVWH